MIAVRPYAQRGRRPTCVDATTAAILGPASRSPGDERGRRRRSARGRPEPRSPAPGHRPDHRARDRRLTSATPSAPPARRRPPAAAHRAQRPQPQPRAGRPTSSTRCRTTSSARCGCCSRTRSSSCSATGTATPRCTWMERKSADATAGILRIGRALVRQGRVPARRSSRRTTTSACSPAPRACRSRCSSLLNIARHDRPAVAHPRWSATSSTSPIDAVLGFIQDYRIPLLDPSACVLVGVHDLERAAPGRGRDRASSAHLETRSSSDSTAERGRADGVSVSTDGSRGRHRRSSSASARRRRGGSAARASTSCSAPAASTGCTRSPAPIGAPRRAAARRHRHRRRSSAFCAEVAGVPRCS